MNLKIKFFLTELIFFFQKILFFFSNLLTFWIPNSKNKKRLIIGRETANLLNMYSQIFNCYSINTSKNKFYDASYSIDLSNVPRFLRYIFLPILFPIFLKQYSSIWFFSAGSFFLSNDGRSWEFKQAKNKNVTIICFFVGSDIRSLKLSKELSTEQELDHWSNYVDEAQLTNSDIKSKLYSEATNNYADVVFSFENDQASYITRKIYMLPTPVSRNKYKTHLDKWNDTSIIKILHSPSSPLIKGTKFVESAIKKLESENYKFEFKLLTNVSQDQVLSELDNAHIALNEFFAYVPGIFGIEALEANCLLLTSASRSLEPTLFEGCDSAWVPTQYNQIYDNLKYYLDNIDLAREQANKGTLWAKKHFSHEATKDFVDSVLNE